MTHNKKKTLSDHEAAAIIKEIRKVCGSGVLVSFKTTSKGSRFYAAENDYEPPDFDDSEGDIKRNFPKIKSKNRPVYFG